MRITQGKISELSFMDHTPGQGQYRDFNMYNKVVGQQYGIIFFQKKCNDIIHNCTKKKKLINDLLKNLICVAKETEVPIVYHNAEFPAQIQWMITNGITICEFTFNRLVTVEATKNNMSVIVGVPNIVLGGSHNNNISALELLKNDIANIICSDYYSPSILLSIFKLCKEYNILLYKAVNYTILNPTKAMKIDQYYGWFYF